MSNRSVRAEHTTHEPQLIGSTLSSYVYRKCVQNNQNSSGGVQGQCPGILIGMSGRNDPMINTHTHTHLYNNYYYIFDYANA